MSKKNILLLCGGGGTEHDISLISADFIKESLLPITEFLVHKIEICRDGYRRDEDGNICEMRKAGDLVWPDQNNKTVKIDFAIPCIHGPPGETGEIQAVFEMMELPYLGCAPEASIQCFNKITTKLWLDALEIPNTPYLFLADLTNIEIQKTEAFFDRHKELYIKASNQGSSVGCYHTTKKENIKQDLKEAFKFSPYVLVEKGLVGRELEVAVYEYKGEVIATLPGEIICPENFYSFEEKYEGKSKTTTHIVATNLDPNTLEEMKRLSIKAFKSLKLKHLARIDFFYTNDDLLFINEINTFPGMTPISMFPKMMDNNGLKFTTFLETTIKNSLKKEVL